MCENDAMLRLALTLESPAENVALDEALLDEAEAAGPATEFLRIWESPTPLVVLGRSSRAAEEVDLDACRTRGIPVLRRSSGGASIVAGRGCLMYAVVLSYDRRPRARGIHESHSYVLDRLADALREQVPTVIKAGTSDLALRDDANPNAARKFSGNSLRVKRSHFLYHGTLLYDFDLPLVAACLRTAPRQPEYRKARDHLAFITNLPMQSDDLAVAIDAAWPTSDVLHNLPRERLATLLRDRYQSDDWGPL
jgi:lipoate-protein ligase A